jgi:hypothetical protein
LIAAAALRSTRLSSLSGLSELTCTLTLLSTARGVSAPALSCLPRLAGGILSTLRSTRGLTGQASI